MKKKGIRIAAGIACAVLLCLLVTGIVCRKAVRAVWANLTVGKLQMEEGEWTGGKSCEKVPYAEDSENQYVDIYVPDTPDGSRPQLYVIIHGGGFITNDSQSRQAQLMFRYFRDHGYACASVNYRLAPEEPFPGALCDCKAAIRFLRAHAEEYGYDADRIAVFGESAGGYLATMCAVTNEEEYADVRYIGQSDAEPVSAKVDVLVDYYGHIDNEGAEEDWKVLGIPKLVRSIANSWVSGDAAGGYEDVESYWFRKNVSEMSEEEKAVFDPYTYIGENDLNGLFVWIIHGDCDITVPYLQSERLNAVLRQKLGEDHVSYRLEPGMGHASDPLFSGEILGELKAYLDEHLK